jgi:hypothetical protein
LKAKFVMDADVLAPKPVIGKDCYLKLKFQGTPRKPNFAVLITGLAVRE